MAVIGTLAIELCFITDREAFAMRILSTIMFLTGKSCYCSSATLCKHCTFSPFFIQDSSAQSLSSSLASEEMTETGCPIPSITFCHGLLHWQLLPVFVIGLRPSYSLWNRGFCTNVSSKGNNTVSVWNQQASKDDEGV